jgi:8-oxo-dGTP diphosphatase
MEIVNVVAAIIIDKVNNTILATQRGDGELAGGWEFPGGKIKDGEEPKEALKREIFEELGAEITVKDLFDIVEYDYHNFHLHMKCYICEITTGSIILNEHIDAKWLNKDALWSIEWLPADVNLVNKISKELYKM